MAPQQDLTLPKLEALVSEVHSSIGLKPDANFTVVQKMAAIEACFDHDVEACGIVPSEIMEALEKAREKDRRQVTLCLLASFTIPAMRASFVTYQNKSPFLFKINDGIV